MRHILMLAMMTAPAVASAQGAPAPVVTMTRPEPRDNWATFTNYRGRSVAEWAVFGSTMQPGISSPPLRSYAIGLPTIVTYSVRGYAPPPRLGPADTLPVPPPSDPLVENNVPGKTIGVEPFPVPYDGACGEQKDAPDMVVLDAVGGTSVNRAGSAG